MQELSSQMLDELPAQLGVSSDQIEYVGGFENLVYRVRGDREDQILRLTDESHRTLDLLHAELDWIDALAAQNIPVAKALSWPSGERVEAIASARGERFWATRFEVAPGEAVDVTNASVWNETLFERWGELLGRMHVASQRYSVPAGAPRRLPWHDDDLLQPNSFLSDEHRDVIEAGQKIIEKVAEFPQTDETFGLVHSDLHHGNFFVSKGQPTAFDFDDSCYHYFAHDLAVALYYACWWSAEGDVERQNTFAATFMDALLRGYRRHRDMPTEWLARLPLFLALRDLTIFVVIHKRLDVDALSDPMKAALQERRARLLGGGTKIDIDFASL